MSETTRECLVCNTTFIVRTFDKRRAKYCSKKCQKSSHNQYDKTLPSKVEKTCLSCDKKFIVFRSQSFRKYCSTVCKKKHWSESGATTGFLDITGHVFERLTVIEYAGHRYGAHNSWLCECSCDKKTRFVVSIGSLRSGRTRSCGCIAKGIGIPQPQTYFCTKCDQEFPYTELFFHKNKKFRWGLAPWCHNCIMPILKKRHLRFRIRLKLEVLSHYSGGCEPRCECCGVTGVEFLTLDHINNDGKEDRKINGIGMVFYAKMKRLGYPPHLQVLCFNCNLARSQSQDGICPHKRCPKN